ncbi:hypothetical protein [Microcoleus sp. T2B6]
METEGSKGNVQRYIYTAKGINRLLIAVQRFSEISIWMRSHAITTATQRR